MSQTLSVLPGGGPDYSQPATELEKEALKKRLAATLQFRDFDLALADVTSSCRYASLKYAGRYWNPYVEWREQGAWVG